MTGRLAEPLETERLLLRPTRPGDEEQIMLLFTDLGWRLAPGLYLASILRDGVLLASQGIHKSGVRMVARVSETRMGVGARL